MAIKLTLKDGAQVEADSVDELLKFYHHVSTNGNGHPKISTISLSQSDRSTEAPSEAVQRLIKVLLASPDGKETQDIAKELGATSKGIGGTVASFFGWGKKHGLTARQILIKRRRPSGHGVTVRTMSLTESFRKMIREGKVPGVKLDT